MTPELAPALRQLAAAIVAVADALDVPAGPLDPLPLGLEMPDAQAAALRALIGCGAVVEAIPQPAQGGVQVTVSVDRFAAVLNEAQIETLRDFGVTVVVA